MFISLSKTLARFGGVRLGVGMRMSKKNAPYIGIFVAMLMMFKAMWYLIIVSFWMVYAAIYGAVWLYCKMFKTSAPFFKKLFEKIENGIKKEGYRH